MSHQKRTKRDYRYIREDKAHMRSPSTTAVTVSRSPVTKAICEMREHFSREKIAEDLEVLGLDKYNRFV